MSFSSGKRVLSLDFSISLLQATPRFHPLRRRMVNHMLTSEPTGLPCSADIGFEPFAELFRSKFFAAFTARLTVIRALTYRLREKLHSSDLTIPRRLSLMATCTPGALLPWSVRLTIWDWLAVPISFQDRGYSLRITSKAVPRPLSGGYGFY